MKKIIDDRKVVLWGIFFVLIFCPIKASAIFDCYEAIIGGSGLSGDADNNCEENFDDFAIFATEWMKNQPEQALLHRWSFNGDTNDSVGAADAILDGFATVTATELDVTKARGELGGDENTRVWLPIADSMATITDEMTIEGWVTITNTTTTAWYRLFVLGDGLLGVYYGGFQYIPSQGWGSAVIYNFQDNYGGNEIGLIMESTTDDGILPVQDVEYHFAIVYHQGVTIELYLNGAPQSYFQNGPGDPKDDWDNWPVNAVPYTHCTIGAAFNGYGIPARVNEFRIYSRALTVDEIASSYANGPDGTPLTEKCSRYDYDDDCDVDINDIAIFVEDWLGCVVRDSDPNCTL